ncbi:MAG: hypothetical protein ACOVQT_03775 [Rubrivivax sp.]
MPTRTAAAPKSSAPGPTPSPRRKTPLRPAAAAAAAPDTPLPSPTAAPEAKPVQEPGNPPLKAASRSRPKAAQKDAAKAAPPPSPKAQGKAPKLHRKPIRERVKLPEADVALMETLKARANAGGRPARKSELVRAGLQALAAMDTPTLVQCLKDLEPLKLPAIRWLE